MASMDVANQKPSDPEKSFAQAVSYSCELPLHQLPLKVIMGDTVRVRITQNELESDIADFHMNLLGRITLAKGDTPWTTQALKIKLSSSWSSLKEWGVLPLGRGFFEFRFWISRRYVKGMGSGCRKSETRYATFFFSWMKAFKPQNQAQTHAQIWVWLM